MALEISSVGAKVKYAFETEAGLRPTTGYHVLPDVNEAPEQDLSLETIDASNITDTITRYIAGRQDPGGDQAFTLNHTDKVIDIWNEMAADAEDNLAAGKRLWFEYWFPGAAKSYFWAGTPQKLGTSGISQNELDTVPAHVVLTDWEGWAEKSMGLEADKRRVTITGTGNETVTISNPTGDATAASSNANVATAELSSTTLTITGKKPGTATVLVRDAGGDEIKVEVTVKAQA